MKNKKIKPTQLIDRDQNIIETNSYLEIQKEHKDWFKKNAMGKQRGKPTMTPKETKKKGK